MSYTNTAADLGRKWQLEIPLKLMVVVGELGPVSVGAGWVLEPKRHEPTAPSLNYFAIIS